MEPAADGFRNYIRKGLEGSAAELLVDKAQLLTLTAPEMTVLVGGMRALNANVGQSKHGVFTKRPETLTNDFFVNLLDMRTKWQKSATSEGVFEGRDRATGELKWTGTCRRSRLRFELPAPGHRGSLCMRRLPAAVCARLCGGVGQGDESRSLRPCMKRRLRAQGSGLRERHQKGRTEPSSPRPLLVP